MSVYDHFSQEALADLLRAYDCYISTAADAGLLTTGWTPVCVEEFYDHEYQEVWDREKGDESFYYMYENAEAMAKDFDQQKPWSPIFAPQTISFLGNAEFFCEMSHLFVRLEDEDVKRPLRSHIKDIKDGDAFFIGTGIHYADGDAHQNLDEKGQPWIVYDVGGDSWFEEDIGNAERILNALQYGKAGHLIEGGTPVNQVNMIRERLSENEQWIDSFWVDARQVPSVELFRAAVGEYLHTKEGLQSIEASCYDFNWGDAMMYVPQEIWNKYGIYPVDPMHPPKDLGLAPTPNNNPVTFTVDQDEVLCHNALELFAENLIFDGEINVSDKDLTTADGYLVATDLLVQRLRDEISPRVSSEILDSMENINFYGVHNLKTGEISLESTFWYMEKGKEDHMSVTLPLTEEEQAVLAKALNDYCRWEYDQSLLLFVNNWRDYHGIDSLVPDKAANPSLADKIQSAATRAAATKEGETTPDKERS